ncbi:MAG: molybdopterin cofactor-binding domain-containing protein [Acidobacteriota bacterium]
MRLSRFTLNGIKQELVCEGDRRLLDVIRGDFGLTGTKRGCDNEGYCGACAVIMDGKAVRSCVVAMDHVPEGAVIETVEGIGTIAHPHAVQKAFAYEGAIQCGYCTPGMVTTAKALLDRRPNPSEEEIRQAFRGNLCRCTGYSSIIRAVQTAGRLMSGEVSEDEIRVDTSDGTFGKRAPRPNSLSKATGALRYGDDVPMPQNTLHLKVVRSPHHHANIMSIDISEAEKMPGVIGVLTAKDIPGSNRLPYRPPGYSAKLVPTEPILCDTRVTHLGRPVAVVVAETVRHAEAAVGVVKVDYEVLPRHETPLQSLREGAAPILSEYDSNLMVTSHLRKGGDQAAAEQAIAESAAVVAGSFATPRIAHLTIEPDNAMAFVDEDGRITIMSKSVAVHLHRMQMCAALGVPPDKLRWIENPSGGSFDSKSVITCEGYVALAAMKFRRPCKIVYTMAETILVASKRARVWVNAKLGATSDGRLTALVYDFDLDAGGYEGVAELVMNRYHKCIGGAYTLPKAYGEGRMALTNSNPFSSVRGPGGVEMALVTEVLVDMMAERLGADPLEFRYQNAWKEGDRANWGATLDCYPYAGMLEKLRPLYLAATAKARHETTPARKRGVGIGGGIWGCEMDGGDRSTVWVELNPDDGVTVYATWADSGQGGDIGVVTIASKALGGLPPEKVRVVSRDSSLTPNSGPSVASRQTATTGNAICMACEALLNAMREHDCKTYADMVRKQRPLRYEGAYVWQSPAPIDKDGQGVPWRNLSYVLNMAEVEVEIATGKVNVLKMTSVVDAGVIHNPLAVEGQCEGGMNMGAGFALWEAFEPGQTDSLLAGGIPNFVNSPKTECHYTETFRVGGALGGVGLGETVMFGAPPAILNAIYDASGARMFDVPATPERVLAALARG